MDAREGEGAVPTRGMDPDPRVRACSGGRPRVFLSGCQLGRKDGVGCLDGLKLADRQVSDHYIAETDFVFALGQAGIQSGMHCKGGFRSAWSDSAFLLRNGRIVRYFPFVYIFTKTPRHQGNE
jgi:hypothetical protein